MNCYYRQIIVKARNRLNHGKKGRCHQGSAFRAFLLTWEKSGEIYFNGSHSSYSGLSLYSRPSGCTNQAQEGSHNGTINIGKTDSSMTRGTYNYEMDEHSKKRRSCFQSTHVSDRALFGIRSKDKNQIIIEKRPSNYNNYQSIYIQSNYR